MNDKSNWDPHFLWEKSNVLINASAIAPNANNKKAYAVLLDILHSLVKMEHGGVLMIDMSH